MVEEHGIFHMYVPLYPAGMLYHPVAMMHGVSGNRLGPWSWDNMTDVEVSFNPGALVYNDSAGTTQYTLWVTKPDGATLGKVYTSTDAQGPFVEVPNSNSTGCYINPSPFKVEDNFYCTGKSEA